VEVLGYMSSQDSPMMGKVVMVTGATSGIGLATAMGLAGQGATVVAVGRNAEKGAEAAARIQRDPRNPLVEFMQADLSVQAEVRRLADEFRVRHRQLHVLVNNVGGFFLRRTLSADGLEMTFALNHLNVFLLTNLLREVLRASAPVRIVNVSSDAHRGAEMDFGDLQGFRRYGGMRAYGRSKLAMLLFTYELARRLEGTGVTVNALHPGFVATSMYESSGGLVKLVAPIIKLMAKSPQEGADTVIHLACSPEVEGVSGKYFKDRQPASSSPPSYDTAAAQRLWKISAEMVGLQ